MDSQLYKYNVYKQQFNQTAVNNSILNRIIVCACRQAYARKRVNHMFDSRPFARFDNYTADFWNYLKGYVVYLCEAFPSYIACTIYEGCIVVNNFDVAFFDKSSPDSILGSVSRNSFLSQHVGCLLQILDGYFDHMERYGAGMPLGQGDKPQKPDLKSLQEPITYIKGEQLIHYYSRIQAQVNKGECCIHLSLNELTDREVYMDEKNVFGKLFTELFIQRIECGSVSKDLLNAIQIQIIEEANKVRIAPFHAMASVVTSFDYIKGIDSSSISIKYLI